MDSIYSTVSCLFLALFFLLFSELSEADHVWWHSLPQLQDLESRQWRTE